jgi:uncharacterized protein
MQLEKLLIYPLKSAQGIALSSVQVFQTGFAFDRFFAIASENDVVLTAREYPKLLNIKTSISEKSLSLAWGDHRFNYKIDSFTTPTTCKLFGKPFQAYTVSKMLNDYLSKALNKDVKLLKINDKYLRNTDGCNINLSDAYPIHLVNQSSVDALNKHLKIPIDTNRFRPNIVVSNLEPFEEYNIKTLRIGACEFKSTIKTNRCTLITINPKNGLKNLDQEPLKTLIKLSPNTGEIPFGIYLVPTSLGTISLSDKCNMAYK